MNLGLAFAASARTSSAKPAIFWGEDVITYDQIWRESQWLPPHLPPNCAVKPGERVAVWLKNRPEFVSVVLGVLLAGGALVPISKCLKSDEVTRILRDSGAKVLISDVDLAEGTAKLRQVFPELQVLEV